MRISALLSFLFFPLVFPSSLVEDALSLLELKKGIQDPVGATINWITNDTSPCSWSGITCSGERVIAINLTSKSLTGGISSSAIASLDALQILDLSQNALSGQIPTQLQNSLRILRLNQNSLTGPLPTSILNASQLTELLVFSNLLSGSIPEDIGILSKLQIFRAGDNLFTGSIPDSIGQLNSLTVLGMANCMLSGSIPASIGNLGNLQSLMLHYNNLSGSIPTTLWRCKALVILGLAENRLQGPIPTDIGNLKSLQTLSMYNNSLSGMVPDEIGHCTSLVYLNLQGNAFEGGLPQSLSLLTNLQTLDLSENILSGFVPDWIGTLDRLRNLALSSNGFTGHIPGSIKGLKQLEQLFLGSNRLTGPIPWEVSMCTALRRLDLSANKLSGQIPSTIGQLTLITDLVFQSNSLTGIIPEEIGSCSSLLVLALYDNLLNGTIPASIGSLQRLESLYLYKNRLSGQIPWEIGHCRNLIMLDLSENVLEGRIPDSIGNLNNLTFLHLRKNRLTGPIPDQISNCVRMRKLDMAENNLSDVIPSDLTRYMSNLQMLLLYQNKLTGPVPRSVATCCVNLTTINLSDNLLQGRIPAELGQWGMLEVLDLTDNGVGGSIPPKLGQSPRLWRLRLGSNQISGPIPPELGNIPALSFVDLSANNLTGYIPVDLSKCRNLTHLKLDHNRLQGRIPAQLGALLLLGELDLSYNSLTGDIPASIFQGCTRLSTLKLAFNRLSGSLPWDLGELQELQFLDLQGNNFQGPIPRSIRKCQLLLDLKLSRNAFQGPLPTQLGNLQNLQMALDLSFNRLTGSIPAELGMLSKLEVLNLSHNVLSGPIPPSLATDMVSLLALNLSYNNLSGPLPDGPVFDRMQQDSFSSNDLLCTGSDAHSRRIVRLPPCEASSDWPTSTSSSSSSQTSGEPQDSRKMTRKGGFIGAVAGALVFFLGATAIVLIFLYKRHKQNSLGIAASDWERRLFPSMSKQLTFSDLMQATDFLSERNIIGSGGFGTVYKATLLSGEVLAVKKVEGLEDPTHDKSFLREVSTLGKVRHRHLVRLVGFCSHKGVNLLVYDYMPNGSLFERLHNSSSYMILDWESRHRIAVGVAEGIAYLHHDCAPCIVHRDIKSNNVLLDSRDEPHLGDFGLAKIMDSSNSSHTLSVFAGSYGYIAPEYAYTMRASEKTDIYSFGVVLMELVTGRLPVDPTFPDGVDIVSWVRLKITQRASVEDLIDPLLEKVSAIDRMQMLLVLKTALMCTSTSLSDRPSMRDVVGKLKLVKQEEPECRDSIDILLALNCLVKEVMAHDGRKERALSFISKSLSDVQKSADQDIKLMKARAKSFRDLASTLDKEWENFKFLGTNKDLLGKLRSRQQAAPALVMSPLTAISAQVEDVEFIRRLRPTFRRIQSDPSFNKHSSSDEGSLSILNSNDGLRNRILLNKSLESRLSLRDEGKRSRRIIKLPTDDWEPLKRVKESLKDLELTAAKSKSPSEFLENVKRTELYENVKSSLGIKLDSGSDVAPLDVPELLESLVRQSEPFLDQLGVRKDAPRRFCNLLRRYKRPNDLVAAPAKDELDARVASVLQSTGYRYKGGLWGECTDPSDDGKRRIAIVTTASLPWMTGTAVNPLFRAAYLAKDGMRNVTLLIPWLCKKDQELVYPNHITFSSPEEQESYVRSWLEERVGFKPEFKIAFYPGRFSMHKRSILACGDISQFIPDKEADVAVLEEPEHLTWYYHGRRWNRKFKDVIGIVHTNYLEYVRREKNGALQAFLLKHVNNWVVGIYCNKVLRLSAATQELPKSQVCNVHGVSPKFLEIGKKLTLDGKPTFSKGPYFLGKMIWGKGYRELVDLLAQHKQELEGLKLDVFGSGEDAADVKSMSQSLGLTIDFHQGRDHADESLRSYKVFINPSVSDVVCTTTAEALAMGKIVVCADHPSNEFFRSFPNCLTYRTPEEFVEKVKLATASEPVPLSAEECHRLSWEAATERFLEYAELDKTTESKTTLPVPAMTTLSFMSQAPSLRDVVDGGLALAHYVASGFEPARLLSGAIPGTMHFSSEQTKDLGLPPPFQHAW